MFTIYFTVISSLAAIGGVIWQYIEKEEAKKKAEQSKKDAENFNSQLLQTQLSLIDEQRRNILILEQLLEAQNKIVELTKDIEKR